MIAQIGEEVTRGEAAKCLRVLDFVYPPPVTKWVVIPSYEALRTFSEGGVVRKNGKLVPKHTKNWEMTAVHTVEKEAT